MDAQPVVIVTGASRGIGAAVARWLATQGAGVTLTARSRDALTNVAEDVNARGGEPLVVPADVADRAACERVVDATLERWGRLDALVNNAGVLEPIARLSEADPEAWSYNVAVNLVGPFYLMQVALPQLRAQRGRIVNVSTGAAVRPTESWSAYCASKAGLLHLTRVVAEEEPDVTAISLRPGVVDTEMQAEIRQSDPDAMPEEHRRRFEQLKEQGELESPEVPARAISWLALRAPNEWSGDFIEYDDSRVAEPARALFGA